MPPRNSCSKFMAWGESIEWQVGYVTNTIKYLSHSKYSKNQWHQNLVSHCVRNSFTISSCQPTASAHFLSHLFPPLAVAAGTNATCGRDHISLLQTDSLKSQPKRIWKAEGTSMNIYAQTTTTTTTTRKLTKFEGTPNWVVPKIKGSKSGTESHSRVCYRFRSFALSLSDIALGHILTSSHIKVSAWTFLGASQIVWASSSCKAPCHSLARSQALREAL